jgi:hypothetical protein
MEERDAAVSYETGAKPKFKDYSGRKFVSFQTGAGARY